MQFVHKTHEILFQWFREYMIDGQSYQLISHMVDLLATRNISCIAKRRCDGTIFMQLDGSTTFYEVDNMKYYVSELLDPGKLARMRVFEDFRDIDALVHMVTKYEYDMCCLLQKKLLF